MSDQLLKVADLAVDYRTARGDVQGVTDVSFAVSRGERVGVVGESGSGKSTVAKALLQLLPPDARISGRAVFDGADLLRVRGRALQQIRWRRVSMIFQNALSALNPVERVGWQLAAPMLAHGLVTKRDVPARVAELLKSVQLSPDAAAYFPHELSGGMRQRVVIALALSCSPDLVIADEPTTALDVVRQDEVLGEIETLQERMGFGLILVTHDISVVAETCDRVMVMYAGQIVETGPVREVFSAPRHPYTAGLIASSSLSQPAGSLVSVPGRPPVLAPPPPGCRFADRCAFAFDACRIEPALVEHGDRSSRCHLPIELGPIRWVSEGAPR